MGIKTWVWVGIIVSLAAGCGGPLDHEPVTITRYKYAPPGDDTIPLGIVIKRQGDKVLNAKYLWLEDPEGFEKAGRIIVKARSITPGNIVFQNPGGAPIRTEYTPGDKSITTTMHAPMFNETIVRTFEFYDEKVEEGAGRES